jgi:hypothetical protein
VTKHPADHREVGDLREVEAHRELHGNAGQQRSQAYAYAILEVFYVDGEDRA